LARYFYRSLLSLRTEIAREMSALLITDTAFLKSPEASDMNSVLAGDGRDGGETGTGGK
jgi:hypothetical protein